MYNNEHTCPSMICLSKSEKKMVGIHKVKNIDYEK
jgi:hypothetical protein